MATIDSLPPELLVAVLGYLDTPPPSETRLHEQPHPLLLTSPEKSLKNASLVCRKWHANALPILFRHVVWELDRWDLLRVDPTQNQNPEKDPIDGLPLLAFLRDQQLARYVDSFSMVVRDDLHGFGAGGSRSASIQRTQRAEAGGDARVIPRFGSPLSTAYNQDSNWVWDMLFQLMNPRKFTILASPQVLALLLSTRIYLQDSWSFSRTTTHALSLSRETKSNDDHNPAAPTSSSSESKTPTEMPNELLTQLTGGVSSEVLQRHPTKLFKIRPWTHLLLNEGSSTRVYKTYEFYHRRPPSILGALLGADRKNPPLVPDTLKSMAYVAVFPLSSHFNTLVDNLPRLDRLYVQLVPRDNILRDPEEMRHVQPSDLWMERNSCYSLVMREILAGEMTGHADSDTDSDTDAFAAEVEKNNNWHHLKEFESGDAADKEAWDMAVQFVCMSGTGWQVEREGVFVKRPQTSTPEQTAAGSDQDEAASSPMYIRGNLQRFSFNGTARLPFSPLSGTMESYVFAHSAPWDIFNTGVESAEVDFFGLLQDVAMDAFADDDVYYPVTMGTIGDLAEAGHFDVWGDDEDEEANADDDYEHDEGEEEEDHNMEEEHEEDDADEDLDEEVDDLYEDNYEHEEPPNFWAAKAARDAAAAAGGSEQQGDENQLQDEEEVDYDPFPDCYDICIDDDDRGNVYDSEIYYGDYAMHDTRYDPF